MCLNVEWYLEGSNGIVRSVRLWGSGAGLLEDPVPFTGAKCEDRSGFSEVKIPHSLVFYPQKAR